MAVTTTHKIVLSKFQEGKNFRQLNRDGVPMDPYRRPHELEEEGSMTQTLPPFLRPGSLHSPSFFRMLWDPGFVYRI